MSALQSLSPGAFLALILGTLYGSLGHLVFGRRLVHLPLFLLTGIASCMLAWGFHLQFFHQLPAPGGLPIVEASAVAWLLLSFVAAWRRFVL
ncbi:MAG: hypothetical protein H0X37_03800 [Herpetosiphonaceae bacterium]|nr:hypothetical protein [Herpetosiphonaceae bacterium]